MAAEFVKSEKKGGDLLVVQQYLYRIDRNIPPVKRWKCRTDGCRATAKTEGGQLIRAAAIAEHGHCNDDATITQLRFKETIKTNVSDSLSDWITTGFNANVRLIENYSLYTIYQ